MERILGFDSQMLIQSGFMIFNILLTVFVVHKLMYKPVVNFLEKRSQKIATMMEETENSRFLAEKLANEYKEKLDKIEFERTEILENAIKKAKEKEFGIIIDAKDEAELIKKRAHIEILREEQKVKDEIKKDVIEISSFMTEKFISEKMDENIQEKLFEKAIKDIGDAKWQS